MLRTEETLEKANSLELLRGLGVSGNLRNKSPLIISALGVALSQKTFEGRVPWSRGPWGLLPLYSLPESGAVFWGSSGRRNSQAPNVWVCLGDVSGMSYFLARCYAARGASLVSDVLGLRPRLQSTNFSELTALWAALPSRERDAAIKCAASLKKATPHPLRARWHRALCR